MADSELLISCVKEDRDVQVGDRAVGAPAPDAVGGGQAGLVTGHYLRLAGLAPLLVDRAPAPQLGDSLRLFTPARYNRFADCPFPGDLEAYQARIWWPTTSSTVLRDLAEVRNISAIYV